MFPVRVALVMTLFAAIANAAAEDKGTSADLHLVYLQDGTTLATYNVDPQTLTPIQVGQPLPLPSATFSFLTASPDGHFLYIQGNDAAQKQHLWVFATDQSGVPHDPPVQSLNADGLSSLEFVPAASFAYAVVGSTNAQGKTVNTIRRFVFNSSTGTLSAPTTVATYPPNGPCSPGAFGGSPSLNGFGNGGTKFFDSWFCAYHEGQSTTYYERALDPNTGTLGPEVEVFTWSDTVQGYDTVSFINDRIYDFSIPNDFIAGVNSFSIYPLIPNSTKPLLRCTAQMLKACGYSLSALFHPSGQYVFFLVNYSNERIAKIDFTTSALVDTGQSIPFQVSRFDAAGTIVYAVSVANGTYDVEIFGFDQASAEVTRGGTIVGPSIADSFWPVERQ